MPVVHDSVYKAHLFRGRVRGAIERKRGGKEMNWERIGAIGALLSFLVTFAAQWSRLRRLTLRGILVPLVLGMAVFVAANNVPTIIAFLPRTPAIHVQRGDQQPSVPTSEEVSSVRLVEAQKTGAEQRRVYNVTLAGDEIIVGDAYDFEDQGYTCVVFMIQGPGSKQFAVLDGAWYRYSGVTNENQAEERLQARVDYLRRHWFCKDVEFPVIRM